MNEIIHKNNPAVFDLLSKKGKEIYFPKDGILAQSAEAKGKKINATIGIALEEDGSPMRLESVASNISLKPQDVFPYAPSFGKLELRQSWKKLIYQKNQSLSSEISLPVATQALTHALSIVGYLFVDENDAIILPDKFWGNYRLIFERGCGAKLETFATFSGSGFDLQGFRNKLSERTGPPATPASCLARRVNKKIVLLNFPNNPTGYSPTEEEADEIAYIIKERAEAGDEIAVICDDAYFGLVYESGIERGSIFSRLANLHERVLAIKVDGPTKEDYVWGLRVGFITFGGKNLSEEIYEALEAKTAGAIRGNVSNISHLSQSLVLKGITSENYEREKNSKFQILKKRYEAVKEILENPEFFQCFHPLPFNSGYFMCLELSPGIDAEAVRKKLLEKYDTGVISVGNLLRVAFSSVKTEDMETLFQNIFKACNEIKSSAVPQAHCSIAPEPEKEEEKIIKKVEYQNPVVQYQPINMENQKPKISIIGAGNVGSQTAFYTALKNLGDVVLIDNVPGMAEGKALDIQESMPIAGNDSQIAGGINYSLTEDSDIVVITAGVTRKPGITRDDLININTGIMKSIVPEVARYSPNCIIIMVTNPLDNMVKLAYEISGFPKERVIGMAGILDTARFKAFVAMEVEASVRDIEAMVLGGHGDLMIPALNSCTIKNVPITQILPKDRLDAIIARTQNGGGEIVELLKTGSAFYAPALAIVEMIEAILFDTKKVLPCSVKLEGEYGESGMFVGVPVSLGRNGAERIIEIPLSEEEKMMFKKSTEHIKMIT